jgi:predicted MPP superfamily phosphohydrolase
MDAASTARSKHAQDPMGESRFHKVLVFTDNLQRLHPFILILIFLGFAALLAIIWPSTSLIPELYLLAVAVSWVILWLLPRTGRSYGPEKASALATAVVLFTSSLILGLIGSTAGVYPLARTAAVVIMAGFTALVFYATWIEPFNLRVTHETLTTPKLRDGSTVRLLHLGDLHLEHISPRERHLNRLVENLQPDVIVFSGDFVNLSNTYDPQTFSEIREVISAWHAPLGVYCVPGTYTVEPLERVKQFTDSLDNLCLLLDECVTFHTGGGAFHVLGMVTRHRLEQDQKTFAKLSTCAPEEDFRLLVTHAPDVALDADAARIDLYVCGHTHGGQIRLPVIGALFSGSHLGKQFIMGRYDLAHTTVYTSRGIGLEGLGAPRARFLCPPEIIVWEIRGQH